MSVRFFLIIAFLLVSGNHLLAQKFSVGLLAGPQVYTLHFEDEDDRDIFEPKIQFGYRAGAYIIFPLENGFAWSVETFYSRRGRKIETIETEFLNTAKYHFWDINFLLRKEYDLNIIENVKGRWFLNLGPNVSHWVAGKGIIEAPALDFNYDVVFEEGRESGDNYNNYIVDGNRWLFGIDLGIGINAPTIDQQVVEVEVRFTLGQTFLGSKDGSIPVNDFQVDDNLRSNYRVLALVVRYGLALDLKNAKKGKSTYRIKSRRRR